MLSFQLILGDKNPPLIEAWAVAFANVPNVTLRGGNLLLAMADALVSPANSFGFMDGGIDWAISDLFEWKIQSRVQRVIRDKHHGELLVGQAEIVETGHERFRYLICAPTMRTPAKVDNTVNAFLAMRAILLSVEEHNATCMTAGNEEQAIKSVAIPGLATGVGVMPYSVCAKQMRRAYDEVTGAKNNAYARLADAIAIEKRLKTAGP